MGGIDNNWHKLELLVCSLLNLQKHDCRQQLTIPPCRELTIDAIASQLTSLTSLYIRKCLASGSMGALSLLTQLRALDLSDYDGQPLESISGDHFHPRCDQSVSLFAVSKLIGL